MAPAGKSSTANNRKTAFLAVVVELMDCPRMETCSDHRTL
jgi:hypothetical protein